MFIPYNKNPYTYCDLDPRFKVSTFWGKYRGKTFASLALDATKAAQAVLGKLLKTRDIETNQVKVSPELLGLSKYQIAKGLKYLKDNAVVLKLDKQTYFINPHLVLPMSKVNLDYNPEAVYALWDCLYAKIETKKEG